MRFSKEHGRVRVALDHPPECELASAVIRDGLASERPTLERRVHTVGRTIRHEVSDGIQAGVHMRQYANPRRALDGVAFQTGSRTFFNRTDMLRSALLLGSL